MISLRWFAGWSAALLFANPKDRWYTITYTCFSVFYLDIWVNIQKILPSTLYIMRPMHLQGSTLLSQPVWEEMQFQANTFFDLWSWHQGHVKYCPAPSTSCELCTCMVWSCYVQRLRSRCINKQIQYLTLTLAVAQYHRHHVTYAPVKFEVATSNGKGAAFTLNTLLDIWPWPWAQCHMKSRQYPLHYLSFDLDLGVKVTQNVTQFPIYHLTYAISKFEVAISNGLGGDAFTRKYTIWPLTLTQGQGETKCTQVPCTSCDLCPCTVLSCYV